jgi:hypothetical protein
MSLGQPGLLAALLHQANFVDVDVRALSAPFRAPTVDHYIDFLRSAASPLIEILSRLPNAAQQSAWRDMRDQLQQFTRDSGWMGPNELLICSATAR